MTSYKGVCGYSWGSLEVGAVNDSGVVDNGIFGDLDGYFFGNLRDKASNIIWRMLPLVSW